jgi:hypothetical protein
MNHSRELSAILGTTAAVLLLLTGCSSKSSASGCTKDSDCKGDRLCIAGECSDGPTKVPPSPQQGAQQPAQQNQQAAQQPASPGAVTYAQDGLPEVIPPPSSAVPTLAEWSAVTREVTVRGSSRNNCETKMVREWLRVSCHKSASKGDPVEVEHELQGGQQAFKFAGPGVTSVVVQVIRGRTYKATFTWDNSGAMSGAELTVQWRSDAPRPEMFFTDK